MDSSELSKLADRLVEAYASAIKIVTRNLENVLEYAAETWNVDEDKKEDTAERVDWMDVFLHQRSLAAFPNVPIVGVRWSHGELCYVGHDLTVVAKVHDPKIGCDGSNTVFVTKR